MRFSLPSIKCSPAPPSFRLLSSAWWSDNEQSLAVVVSWEDPPNTWLTAAKNAFVGWAFNFRVRVLLKSAVRNRKHVPCFYRVIQTRVEVWENEKCCGNTSRREKFPQLFWVLPNFHECLYNSIETRSTCFLFLLENNATRKRKTTC